MSPNDLALLNTQLKVGVSSREVLLYRYHWVGMLPLAGCDVRLSRTTTSAELFSRSSIRVDSWCALIKSMIEEACIFPLRVEPVQTHKRHVHSL